MSSLSQRRSAMGMILGVAATAAILLASAQAALADNIPFDFSSVQCYAFAYAVGEGANGEVADGPYDTGDVTTPVSVSAQAGGSYGSGTAYYALSEGNTVLTVSGGIEERETLSSVQANGEAQFFCRQAISVPTLVHAVG